MKKDVNKLKSGVYLSPCGRYFILFKSHVVHWEMTTPIQLGRNVSWHRLFNYEYLGEL